MHPAPPIGDNGGPQLQLENQPAENLQSIESLIPLELTNEAPSSSTSSGGDHLAALESEMQSAEAAAQVDAPQIEDVPACVSREQFRISIIGAFNFGGLFLKSFAVSAEETPRAEAAADALYDTALEVHWLRWLLDPQAATVQRLFVIFAFVGPKARAIMAEVKAARAAKPKDPEPVAVAAAHSGPRDPEPTR